MRKGFRTAAAVVMGIIALKALFMLAGAVLSIWQQEYGGDALLFTAVGRAILNGLTPYADIWENKPPGIFLLTAAGQWFENGLALVRVVEAACIVLLAAPIVGAVAWQTRKHRPFDRAMSITTAFLFGVLLSFLSFSYDDGLMTEVFGAMIGVAYVSLLAIAPARLSTRWIVPLGILLWAAAFFKEPFALALFASIFVLRPFSLRTWEECVLQGCVALTVHVVVLAFAGMAAEYFTIYLPYLIWDHRAFVPVFSSSLTPIPVWMLGLNAGSFVTYLWKAHMLLALSAVTCWAIAVFLPMWGKKAITASSLWRAALLLATTYLVLFAVSFSGDWGHRTLVAIPWLAALFFANLRTFRAGKGTRAAGMVGVAFACVIALSVIALPLRWQPSPSHSADEHNGAAFGRTVDAMLDACGIDRYLELSHVPQEVHGFTRHSPLPSGPFTVRLEQRLSVKLFRDMIDDSLERADVVLLRNPELVNTKTYAPDLVALLEKVHARFKAVPWPCATSFTFPADVFVLFRKK